MANSNAQELMDLELKCFLNLLDDGISWNVSRKRLFIIKIKGKEKKLER